MVTKTNDNKDYINLPQAPTGVKMDAERHGNLLPVWDKLCQDTSGYARFLDILKSASKGQLSTDITFWQAAYLLYPVQFARFLTSLLQEDRG